MARLAALLFEQADAADHHAPVDGLAHVVNGQQADGNILINNTRYWDNFRFYPSRLDFIWTRFGQDFSPFKWASLSYLLTVA